MVHQIGQGAFGKVFLCKSFETKELSALKYIDPKSDRERYFLNSEIAVMKSLEENDYVVRFLEGFIFSDRVWMFMEYLEYGCLSPLIAVRKGTITEHLISYILRQVLEGLYYLHRKHIVHRDIKSDNVLINANGQIKVRMRCDHGFSFATLVTLRS